VYASEFCRERALTDSQQSAFLAESYLLFQSLGVKAYVWHQLTAIYTAIADSNFGLFDNNGNQKPAFDAFVDIVNGLTSSTPTPTTAPTTELRPTQQHQLHRYLLQASHLLYLPRLRLLPPLRQYPSQRKTTPLPNRWFNIIDFRCNIRPHQKTSAKIRAVVAHAWNDGLNDDLKLARSTFSSDLRLFLKIKFNCFFVL
jgi:hypothetical protein